MVALIIHGGAGSMSGSLAGAKKSALQNILLETSSLLEGGAQALTAVEHAVKLLEDDPLFNAGRGSYPNVEGAVEMDAIIIEGTSLNFGAVAGIKNIGNPVAVARKVLDQGKCCLLAGEGATRFARAHGFEFVPDQELASKIDRPSGALGTVGAVALDSNGGIAAATSTGGTARKPPGRVGDSPLIGCGAIADSLIGGVSATGEGEFLMRIMISRVVLDCLQRGMFPEDAAVHAIDVLGKRVQGKGGVICLNKEGQTGYAFNTPGMAVAYFNGKGETGISV